MADLSTDTGAAGRPRIEKVLETALYVDDIDRARDFYERVLGLEPLLVDRRVCAYDVGGRSVLLLFERGGSTEAVETPGGIIPPHDGSGPQHVGLAIAADQLDAWERHLGACGVEILSRTRWSRGGVSIYFRDPDGLLLELATPGLWKTY